MDADVVLRKHGACMDAVEWLGMRRAPKAAWDACERGDWLLWIAARLGVKREIVVFAACQCARLALKYTKDPRVLNCIETTEAWTRGKASIEDVRRDRAAADAAAADAAYAAADAAYAADAAAYAAYAAAAVGKEAQRACAALVRQHIPWKLVKARLDAG